MSMPMNAADALTLQTALAKVFPHVSVTLNTRGGPERASLSIVASLDARETWANGILHNSRFLIGGIDEHGTLTCTAKGLAKVNGEYVRLPTLRMTRRAYVAGSTALAVDVLTRWANACPANA